jgi:raffinose/stachyose/melibiose transport system permease protein
MINIVLSLINGFKQFDQIFTMTRGGPGNRTETISLLIFNKGYEANDLPYASAAAVVLFMVVMMISTLIIRRFQRREGDL